MRKTSMKKVYLIIESIEEVDPEGRSFGKLSEDEDSFYAGAVPDAPELKLGKRKNWMNLCRKVTNSR